MEATASGVKIHYTLSGQGTKRVVLLHGWGCEIKLMQPVAEALQQDMQVLCIDFPGHGASGRPPEPWGVPEYAACLKELLQQLNYLPCAAVAHSFGARVAVYLASEDPTAFTKLVLTGAAGIRAPQSEESKKRSEQFKRLKGMCEGLKKARIFGTLPDKAEDALRRKYGSADYNALDEEMRKTFVKVVNLDLTDRLHEIKQPALLLWGTKDTATPLWMGKKMEELIPDAGLVELEEGTHFAYLEQCGKFCTIVRHFLLED